MLSIMELCDIVRQSGFELHAFLRHGHLEKVYQNGLAHRLGTRGIPVKQQHALTVRDEDGTILGEYVADLFVDERLIVELKACRTLLDEHVAQLLGYMRASRIEHGLLINFGARRYEIRKFVLSEAHPQ